jgi:hypothetical protein
MCCWLPSLSLSSILLLERTSSFPFFIICSVTCSSCCFRMRMIDTHRFNLPKVSRPFSPCVYVFFRSLVARIRVPCGQISFFRFNVPCCYRHSAKTMSKMPCPLARWQFGSERQRDWPSLDDTRVSPDAAELSSTNPSSCGAPSRLLYQHYYHGTKHYSPHPTPPSCRNWWNHPSFPYHHNHYLYHSLVETKSHCRATRV